MSESTPSAQQSFVVVCIRDDRGHFRVDITSPSSIAAMHAARAAGHTPVLAYSKHSPRREVSRILAMLRTWPIECPACLYSLAGLTPDENGWVACPECGLAGAPGVPPRRQIQIEVPHPRYRAGAVLAWGGLAISGIGLVAELTDPVSLGLCGALGTFMGIQAYERSRGRRGKATIVVGAVAIVFAAVVRMQAAFSS